MGITVIQKSDLLAVSLEDLKANKRIYNNLEDQLYIDAILDAQDFIEVETNRAIMSQEIRLDLTGIYPEVHLPRPPSFEVTKITTIEDGVSTDVDITGGVSVDFVDCMLSLVSVPGVDAARAGRMSIEYIAGVSAPKQVDRSLRRGVMLLASHYITSREAAFMDKRVMDVVKEIPFGVDRIIEDFRVPNVRSQFDGV